MPRWTQKQWEDWKHDGWKGKKEWEEAQEIEKLRTEDEPEPSQSTSDTGIYNSLEEAVAAKRTRAGKGDSRGKGDFVAATTGSAGDAGSEEASQATQATQAGEEGAQAVPQVALAAPPADFGAQAVPPHRRFFKLRATITRVTTYEDDDEDDDEDNAEEDGDDGDAAASIDHDDGGHGNADHDDGDEAELHHAKRFKSRHAPDVE